LQVKDLESVEKKAERLKRAAKSGDKDAMHGLEVLERYREHFEGFNDALTFPIKDDEKNMLMNLFLLTMKPVMYVCNVDEKSALTGNRFVERVKEYLAGRNAEYWLLPAPLRRKLLNWKILMTARRF